MEASSGRGGRSVERKRRPHRHDPRRINGRVARIVVVLDVVKHSVQQFAQRFSNDLDTIREGGGRDHHPPRVPNVRTYDIRCYKN